MNEELPARITLAQVYMRQVKDGTETKSLLLVMQEQIKNALVDLADHETRLRDLEKAQADVITKHDMDRQRNWYVGLVGALGTLVLAVGAILALRH